MTIVKQQHAMEQNVPKSPSDENSSHYVDLNDTLNKDNDNDNNDGPSSHENQAFDVSQDGKHSPSASLSLPVFKQDLSQSRTGYRRSSGLERVVNRHGPDNLHPLDRNSSLHSTGMEFSVDGVFGDSDPDGDNKNNQPQFYQSLPNLTLHLHSPPQQQNEIQTTQQEEEEEEGEEVEEEKYQQVVKRSSTMLMGTPVQPEFMSLRDIHSAPLGSVQMRSRIRKQESYRYLRSVSIDDESYDEHGPAPNHHSSNTIASDVPPRQLFTKSTVGLQNHNHDTTDWQENKLQDDSEENKLDASQHSEIKPNKRVHPKHTAIIIHEEEIETQPYFDSFNSEKDIEKKHQQENQSKNNTQSNDGAEIDKDPVSETEEAHEQDQADEEPTSSIDTTTLSQKSETDIQGDEIVTQLQETTLNQSEPEIDAEQLSENNQETHAEKECDDSQKLNEKEKDTDANESESGEKENMEIALMKHSQTDLVQEGPLQQPEGQTEEDYDIGQETSYQSLERVLSRSEQKLQSLLLQEDSERTTRRERTPSPLPTASEGKTETEQNTDTAPDESDDKTCFDQGTLSAMDDMSETTKTLSPTPDYDGSVKWRASQGEKEMRMGSIFDDSVTKEILKTFTDEGDSQKVAADLDKSKRFQLSREEGIQKDDESSTDRIFAGKRRKASHYHAFGASQSSSMDDGGSSDTLTDELCPPSFSQFALFSLDPEYIFNKIDDVRLFVDDGPRHLDSFSLHQDIDFNDYYCMDEERQKPMTSKAISCFCFPNGLRVRYLPAAGIRGARRLGWLGPEGDSRHILVFTNASGATDHGVAITIRWEINLKVSERRILSDKVYKRRKKRRAARKISRWWRKQSEKRVLTEALKISGVERRATIDDLRKELDPAEMKMLARSIKKKRNWGFHRLSSNTTEKKSNKGGRGLQGLQKRFGKKKQQPSTSTDEIGEMTRNALMRSPSFAQGPGDGASVTTASTSGTAESFPRFRTPKAFLRMGSSFRTNHRMVGQSLPRQTSTPAIPQTTVADPPITILCDTSSTSIDDTGIVVERSGAKRYDISVLREKARESYETMKQNDRMGSICVVEKCYTLIGCQPDEHVLLLGPLQYLVDAERNELLKFRRQKREARKKRKSRDRLSEETQEERRVVEIQQKRRETIIRAMFDRLRLNLRQALVVHPRSQMEHIKGKQYFFRASIPEIPFSPEVKVPLPLPRVGKQWALAKLMLDLGPDALIYCLKLLFMERSLLVVGPNIQEVTACCCAFVELLKPFEWASCFMPVLPRKMMDFLNSPVPFIAGIVANDVNQIENDERTLMAMAGGMSLVCLKSNSLRITTEEGVNMLLSLDTHLRDQLRSLCRRLRYYCDKNPASALKDFPTFIRKGLTRHESLTLQSVTSVLEGYFTTFCGDLPFDGKAWKQYGTIQAANNRFSFHPEWFLNSMQAERAFHEAMVHTQLFCSYVHDRRQDNLEMEALERGEVGQFIAGWVYRKWRLKKQRDGSNASEYDFGYI